MAHRLSLCKASSCREDLTQCSKPAQASPLKLIKWVSQKCSCNSSAMPPKRQRGVVKLEQPPSSSGGDSDSDSSSDISVGSYRRDRQCSRAIKLSARRYSLLSVDALLCLIVGITARLSAIATNLNYENVFGNGRIVRESIRVCSGALGPLSEALDELSAVEAALADRLQMIEDARDRCARRASLRPSSRQ